VTKKVLKSIPTQLVATQTHHMVKYLNNRLTCQLSTCKKYYVWSIRLKFVMAK